MTPRLDLVAAVAANGVIGRKGQLPWHLPDDLKHFKRVTMGHPVVMGRRTFESVGKPLPGRRNIVVSQSMREVPPGFELAHSLDDAIALVGKTDGRICIVGGGVLYADAIGRAQLMHLTELDEPAEGDAFFPTFDRRDWEVTSDVPHERDERHAIAFHFRTYERRQPPISSRTP